MRHVKSKQKALPNTHHNSSCTHLYYNVSCQLNMATSKKAVTAWTYTHSHTGTNTHTFAHLCSQSTDTQWVINRQQPNIIRRVCETRPLVSLLSEREHWNRNPSDFEWKHRGYFFVLLVSFLYFCSWTHLLLLMVASNNNNKNQPHKHTEIARIIQTDYMCAYWFNSLRFHVCVCISFTILACGFVHDLCRSHCQCL